MSDNVAAQGDGHYPECKSLDEWEVFDDTDGHKSIRQKCICDVLRASEQRVGVELVDSVLDGTARLEGRRLVFMDEALTAATEAVAALWEPKPNVPMPLAYLAGLQAAHRVVDALREERP